VVAGLPRHFVETSSAMHEENVNIRGYALWIKHRYCKIKQVKVRKLLWSTLPFIPEGKLSGNVRVTQKCEKMQRSAEVRPFWVSVFG
jgi:hypothetical protein